MAWNNSQWQKPNAKATAPTPKKTSGMIKGAIAGLIVVLAAGIAWYLLSPSVPAPSDTPPPAKTAKAAKTKTKEVKKEVVKEVGKKAKPDKASVAKTATDAVAQAEPSAPAEPTEETVAETPAAPPIPPPTFANSTDQLIAMATGVPEGCTIPPLPNMTPDDTDKFIDSLKKPIVINEDDSDSVKAAKERVSKVREQIVQLMTENPGKELSTILNEHREDFNYISDVQADVKKGLSEYLDAGDKEGAAKYLTLMNAALQQAGVPAVQMPADDEEADNEKSE